MQTIDKSNDYIGTNKNLNRQLCGRSGWGDRLWGPSSATSPGGGGDIIQWPDGSVGSKDKQRGEFERWEWQQSLSPSSAKIKSINEFGERKTGMAPVHVYNILN